MPDGLARNLLQEMARLAGKSDLLPGALERLSFYFVVAADQQVLLFPAPNVHIAIERWESPPADCDEGLWRSARNYFYRMMCFAEADRQNRLQIPDHIREHAGINGSDDHIALVCRDLWVSLVKGSALKQQDVTGGEALNQLGPGVQDPVHRPQPLQRDASEQQ